MILGTVQSVTSKQGVTLLIDGETTPTAKKYMWLSPYYPEIGDRVLIEEISGSYVILGRVSNDFTECRTRFLRNNISNNDNGMVSFGIRNGDLYFGLAPYDGSSYTLYKVQKA